MKSAIEIMSHVSPLFTVRKKLNCTLATPSFQKCSVKKNKKVESRIGYCTKYNKLDRTKISKCYHCKHYVDLRNEGLSQEKLSEYGRLSETVAVHIAYLCNHCSSTLELFKSLTEKLDAHKEIDEFVTDVKKPLMVINATTQATQQDVATIKDDLIQVKGRLDAVENRHTEFVNQIDCLNEKVKIINQLQEKLENLTQELEDIKKHSVKCEILEKQISAVNEMSDYESNVLSRINSQAISLHKDSSDDIFLERERYRRFKRRNRVVFIGVPKDMSDTDFINELSRELNLDIDASKITNTFKIKARNIPPNKSPPLNVEFFNNGDRQTFLDVLAKNKCNFLPGNSKFKDVQCFPDRTFMQRENFKALKREMDDKNKQLEAENFLNVRYVIKNMTLTKITVFGEEENAV